MTEYERVSTTQERLKEIMQETKKKPSTLAKETGLHKGTICRYLTGEVEPRHEATHKLALALRVSETWLWGYDVPKERVEFIQGEDGKKNPATMDGMSENRKKLMHFVEGVPEEKTELLLRVMKSILEAD